MDFDGNPRTTVVVAYSPTNCAEESVVEDFYRTLRSTIQDVPAHNFLGILADFNARIGPEVAPHVFHDSTNRNGFHLGDLMTEHGLIAANAQFQKRPGKLWTFKDRATDALRQLDYILIRKKWRNSLLNAEAYNSFSSVGSDHRVVCAKIRLSLRTAKQVRKIRYDWKCFSSSPEIQAKYTVEVKNRYQVLEEDDNGACFNKFVDANRQAMEKCVPQKPKRKTVHTSTNPQVVAARKRADDAHNTWDRDS